jgi:hypothetical protein
MIQHIGCSVTLSDQMPFDDFRSFLGVPLRNHLLPRQMGLPSSDLILLDLSVSCDKLRHNSKKLDAAYHPDWRVGARHASPAPIPTRKPCSNVTNRVKEISHV